MSQLWIDADACPRAVKEILYRAANREKVLLTLIANQFLTLPRSPFINLIQVEQGFDVADGALVDRAQPGDLVISSDIPLASLLVNKGVCVVTPRGEIYDKNNIQAALSLRNFMDTLRSSGVETGGPQSFNARDQHAFAKVLEHWLNDRKRIELRGTAMK